MIRGYVSMGELDWSHLDRYESSGLRDQLWVEVVH